MGLKSSSADQKPSFNHAADQCEVVLVCGDFCTAKVTTEDDLCRTIASRVNFVRYCTDLTIFF